MNFQRPLKYPFLPAGLVLAFLVFALPSCSRKESVPGSQTTTQTTTETHTVHVQSIDLGRGLTSDRRVITTDQSFTPGDTVYAAVVLAPPVPSSQITARWVASDGTVVYESTLPVTPGETEAVMQFKMAKPAGIPPGDYRVEVLADSQVVMSKEFKVTAPAP